MEWRTLDLGQGVTSVSEEGAHHGVELGLQESPGVSGVWDEPDLPGVSLSGQTVETRGRVDAALGEEDDVTRVQSGPQERKGLPHLSVEIQQSQLARV